MPHLTSRSAPALGVGVLVVLVLAAGSVTAGARLGAPAQRPAVAEFHQPTPSNDVRVAAATPSAAPALPAPAGTTTRASVGANGGQADAASGGVSAILAGARPDQAISADGRWVAFASAATNLVPGGSSPGIFLRDRQAGTTSAIPWTNGGPFPANTVAGEPAISADGGVVAFTIVVMPAVSRGLLNARTPTPYVLAWDRTTGATTVVSIDAQQQPTPGWQPSISGDGRYVAYTTWVQPDTTPPVLSGLSASPNCFSSGGSTTVTVTVTDPDDAVASVLITVSPTGASSFQQPMNPAGVSTWTFGIASGSGWTDGFVDYTVTATDTHGNAASASSNHDTSGTNYAFYVANGCIV